MKLEKTSTIPQLTKMTIATSCATLPIGEAIDQILRTFSHLNLPENCWIIWNQVELNLRIVPFISTRSLPLRHATSEVPLLRRLTLSVFLSHLKKKPLKLLILMIIIDIPIQNAKQKHLSLKISILVLLIIMILQGARLTNQRLNPMILFLTKQNFLLQIIIHSSLIFKKNHLKTI